MSQVRNAEEFKNYVPNTRKVNGQPLNKDVEITEVKSAEKLKTARVVSFKGAVESTPTAFDGSNNINVVVDKLYEGNIDFGGKSRYVHLSPIDTALIPEFSANRIAFIKDSAVKFELSNDNGETWIDVSENYDGTMLCTSNIMFGIGNTLSDKSINRQQRITIDCIDGGVYCELAKIFVQVDTSGAKGCQCKVEFGDASENTVWTTKNTEIVAGWTGWNVINIPPTYIGKNEKRYVRLTFSISQIVDEYTCNLNVMSLRFVSRICYGEAPSILARKGVMYTFDKYQNVTFPNNIYISGDTLKIGNTTINEEQLQALLALLT